MGVGRFFCVALPLILTIGSIGTLLYAVLAGVAHENVKLIQVDLSNLSISPLSLKTLTSRAEFSIKESQTKTDNITATDLGLHKYYDLTLWGSCSSDDNKKWTCSKAQFDWATKQINVDDIKEGSATIQLPKDIKDALTVFRKLIKWSEIAFIIALVGLGLELIIGIFSNFSRAVSCLTWFESVLTTILVIIACSLSTATVGIIAGVVQGSKSLYGAKVHLDGRFLAIIWIGAAFCIGASLFWIFTICCCKPEKRQKKNHHQSVGDGEKLLPTGGFGSRGYAPLGEQTGYTSGAPRFASGSGRSDLAYEPYSHRA
ncbi:integral membrane [Trichoderma arundinaceum]|uniref:Integral membrane n=1 Tax=Trichoderma arundinaceum TaxID=490622 RepID=A0A395ND44_TRIAR|nr:integral membrane [Trichoderma arundinaceum]